MPYIPLGALLVLALADVLGLTVPSRLPSALTVLRLSKTPEYTDAVPGLRPKKSEPLRDKP
jgi:hypothetical protein